MASVQVRHSRSCPDEGAQGRQESLENALERTCGCRFTCSIVTRHTEGGRERVARNPKWTNDQYVAEALKRLRSVEVHVDEGDYQAPQHERFATFADAWLESLRRRETTHANYAVTIAYAKRAIGRKYIAKLTVADVRKVLELVEKDYRERHKPKPGEKPREVSPTTLAKHLRQLSACLESAVAEGLLAVNPCKRLPKSLKPKLRKKAPAYFTNQELERLWPELAKRPIYVTAAKLAVTTGLRHGELAGLRWNDVDQQAGELRIRRQFTAGKFVERTKDDEERVIDLVPAARELLREWWVTTGDDGLVFELETGGALDNANSRKALYAAMKRAGVPRVGERGGTRDWHSFRHTFARVALEHGAQLEWVQAQLGHSSITLTRDLYGAWSREAEKREAERLDGAFAV
jgi:integrase